MKPNGIEYLSRAFVDSVDIPTKGAMALRVSGSTDGKFTLEPGNGPLVCAASPAISRVTIVWLPS